MSEPVRIQRKRIKGWKAPAGVVNVTRPGHYGNPFKVGHWYIRGDVRGPGRLSMTYTEALNGNQDERFTRIETAADAVSWYRWYVQVTNASARIRRDLEGASLMCFCALDQPCHADVLLEIANSKSEATDV